MLFRIGDSYDRRPCDDAVQMDYLRLDERTADDPAKIPWSIEKKDVSWWYANGQNHRVSSEGRIQRDMPARAWFVEVSDLKQLLDLVRLYNMRPVPDRERPGEWALEEAG